MTTAYEIPLTATPQSFSITLGGTQYNVTLKWNVSAGVWVIDLADVDGNPVLCGVPLVTGVDLLEPYGYLNFGGQLFALTDNAPDTPPSFTDLGDTSHLYWVVS